MKFKLTSNNSTQRRQAFTLVEMMVTVGIFGLVIMGVIYAQLMGLRIDQLTHSKLGASEQSRRSYDLLTIDIRSAKIWAVGNGTVSGHALSGFTLLNDGSEQKGNALRLHLSTDTNKYILYFFDTNTITAGKLNVQLRRSRNGVSGSTMIAQYIQGTNLFFRNEDFRGTITTDQSYKGVISILLEFYQYQYPITRVGNGFYYDYYRTQFKLTPHVPDGP
jgi:prepilin-type N-terminal cleavage/methylation domain-containing protein